MKIDKSKVYDIFQYRYTNFDRKFMDDLVCIGINTAVCRNLIKYRKKHNLTQKELAQKIGFNQSMIAKLERGDYNPTIKFLFELSNKLTGDYTFFIKVISDITKIAKENDKRNKEISTNVAVTIGRQRKKNKSATYDTDTNIPISKVSEKSEEYNS